MKNSIYGVIILCMCLGCKPKASQPQTVDNTIKSTAAIEDSKPTGMIPYFVASGTEPFWSLEISNESIRFKTPTDSIMIPHTNPDLAQDANVKGYSMETESATMNVQILQRDCTNAMSGNVSPYSVTIDIKKGVDKDFQKFEGCGHYNTDYRLHDIWVLENLNGKTISKEDFNNELPSMEIRAAENTFTGFAGCNRMNGKLFFEKGLLRFTNIATTKMMCEPINKEPEFLKALQNSTTYSIENNRLTLSNPSGVLTVFKKID